MNLLSDYLVDISKKLTGTINAYGVESPELKAELDSVSKKLYPHYMMVSNLEKLVPVYLCERSLNLAGIENDNLQALFQAYFMKMLNSQSVNLIHKKPDRFVTGKDKVYKDTIKIKSKTGEWVCMYTFSKLLHVTESGTIYIISIGINMDNQLQHLPIPDIDQNSANENAKNNSAALSDLTTREKEVLKFILGNHSNSEIAEKLVISNHTVHAHRKNIMRKLGVKGSMELARIAMNSDLMTH